MIRIRRYRIYSRAKRFQDGIPQRHRFIVGQRRRMIR
jgi:hypothetical protein